VIELGKDGEAVTNRDWCSKALVGGGTYFFSTLEVRYCWLPHHYSARFLVGLV